MVFEYPCPDATVPELKFITPSKGLIAAVDHFGGEYALYALLAQSHPLPGGKGMLWLQGWFWMLFVGLIVFLLLLFPTGRLPSSRWRLFAWASVAVISAAVIWSSAISPDVGFNAPPNPVQLSVLLLGGVAAGSVIVGRRNARGVERQQIKWLLYVGPLFFIAAGLHIGLYYFWLPEESWGLWVSYLLVTVGGLSGPFAIGVAILRYRLYDIDIIINRTLVYGSLTATLIALHFGGIVVLQRVFVVLAGQQSTLAVVASTLAIAAMFNPLRHSSRGWHTSGHTNRSRAGMVPRWSVEPYCREPSESNGRDQTVNRALHDEVSA
jgi:hypothetical protein